MRLLLFMIVKGTCVSGSGGVWEPEDGFGFSSAVVEVAPAPGTLGELVLLLASFWMVNTALSDWVRVFEIYYRLPHLRNLFV